MFSAHYHGLLTLTNANVSVTNANVQEIKSLTRRSASADVNPRKAAPNLNDSMMKIAVASARITNQLVAVLETRNGPKVNACAFAKMPIKWKLVRVHKDGTTTCASKLEFLVF